MSKQTGVDKPDEQSNKKLTKNKTNKHRGKQICSVKRRKSNVCGICGGENLVEQGVLYCEKCGDEIDFLELPGTVFRWWKKDRTDGYGLQCGHNNEYYISVIKCLDCGSIRSRYCPVCSKRKGILSIYSDRCWRSSKDGLLYCITCSFTGYRKEKGGV